MLLIRVLVVNLHEQLGLPHVQQPEIRRNLIFPLIHLAHPSTNGESAKFSTPLAFDLPFFRNGARYLKCKTNLVRADDCSICPPQLWYSSASAPDIRLEVGSLLKIGRGNL